MEFKKSLVESTIDNRTILDHISTYIIVEQFRDLLSNLHSDSFSIDFIVVSEVFVVDRDQRISVPGYYEIVTRLGDMNDDYRGGVA